MVYVFIILDLMCVMTFIVILNGCDMIIVWHVITTLITRLYVIIGSVGLLSLSLSLSLSSLSLSLSLSFVCRPYNIMLWLWYSFRKRMPICCQYLLFCVYLWRHHLVTSMARDQLRERAYVSREQTWTHGNQVTLNQSLSLRSSLFLCRRPRNCSQKYVM